MKIERVFETTKSGLTVFGARYVHPDGRCTEHLTPMGMGDPRPSEEEHRHSERKVREMLARSPAAPSVRLNQERFPA